MALPTTGLTAHFDASSSDDLWKTFVSGGPHTGTPVDGESVVVWDQEESANRIFKQHGVIDVPVWRSTTPLMPLPCLDFTGGQRLRLTNNADSVLSISEIITNSAHTVLIAFYAETITTLAGATQPYNGEPLIGDTGGYWGAFLHVVVSVPYISAFNWDGNSDVVSFNVSAGVPHVFMMRHQGGILYASLDGGVESSVASGNTQQMVGFALMGAGTYSSGNLNSRIGEVAIYNTALTGSDLTDAVSYFTSKWLTPPVTVSNERTQLSVALG